MKETFYKGWKGWLFGYHSKCPECEYWALCDDLNDDYWTCKYCGYSDDRYYGRIRHGKYYRMNQ